jgi:hypothetical protein
MLGFGSRRKLRTSTYSIELRFPGPHGLLVIYRDASGEVIFDGEHVGRGDRAQLNVQVPNDLSSEDVARMVPRLAEGLAALHKEFVILRVGPSRPVPETEKADAIAQLREMGYEPVVSDDASSVKLQPLPNWKKANRGEAQLLAARMMRLTRIARGKRADIEILARSESATAEFI